MILNLPSGVVLASFSGVTRLAGEVEIGFLGAVQKQLHMMLYMCTHATWNKHEYLTRFEYILTKETRYIKLQYSRVDK